MEPGIYTFGDLVPDPATGRPGATPTRHVSPSSRTCSSQSTSQAAREVLLPAYAAYMDQTMRRHRGQEVPQAAIEQMAGPQADDTYRYKAPAIST